MADQQGPVTQLLEKLRVGDREAMDQLVPLLYGELRRVARGHLRREREGHTLSTTALINEAYIRLLENEKIDAENRVQFLGVASNTMRRILINYALARKREKRGGGEAPVPLEEADAFLSVGEAEELLALDAALDRLGERDDRALKVVECRFFGGLTNEETGRVLGVSAKTVQRSWLTSRTWLRKEVGAELGL